MSKGKHTPGPWRLEAAAIVSAAGAPVLEAFHSTGDTIALEANPENEAVLLAAPDMLEALLAARDHFLAIRYGIDAGYGPNFIHERIGLALRDIDTALAKARGEADA